MTMLLISTCNSSTIRSSTVAKRTQINRLLCRWVFSYRPPGCRRTKSDTSKIAISLTRPRPRTAAGKSSGVAQSSWHVSSSSIRSTSTTTVNPLITNWTVFPKSFSVGTLAGLMGSLAGMGGGFVMIPMMTSRWLQLTQHQAHGTSLFAVMATGVAGALSFGSEDQVVQWDAAAAVAASGMISARLGAQVSTNYLSGKMLRKLLGILMLVMAPAIPAKAYIIDHYAAANRQKQLQKQAEGDQNLFAEEDSPTTFAKLTSRLVPPAMIGIVSGFLAGVFGVGGGVIVVPALTVALDMNHYQALGTSLAAMTPPAAVGVYTHYTAGNVAMRVAPSLALGAFCGAYLGGSVGLKTDETTLRWGFSSLLAVLGIHTILRA